MPDSPLDVIACRQEQSRQLQSLFGSPIQMTAPCVFVYGHSATGKTLVLRSLLQKLTHIFVNCVECYSARLLFQRVLNELSGHVPSAANDFTSYSRCDNTNDFVRILKHLMQQKRLAGTLYLVLQKAERLRDMEANLLPALLRLQHLTGENVCVILESEIVWNKFWCGTGFQDPIIIHFPEYSKDELLEIMLSSSALDGEYSSELKESYCNLVISVFHTACRNLRELQHMAQLNFPKYVEPIVTGEVQEDDVRKLWRNVEPHLKRALQTVYLHEISSSQWERMQAEKSEEKAPPSALSSRVSMELPYYSKFLLIAAYLASYNPSKSDRRFFSKNAGRINKRTVMNVDKKSERTSSQMLGPKSFGLDRLMAIFYSIVEEKVAPSAYIFSQMTSLVNLGLMTRISVSDSLESPKFKCLVSLDMIRAVAKNVSFDVVRYLYDFVG
ncbi:hypothetical protein CAPTEDRAFT_162477 [Capitella teleta]|uniref:Origin recognition complex subunit 5 n=1 Tax=Capitella teleta TaxID=283909 RepID=R7T8N6_CAPTE|nr:hypothetical protein CAPTEDRAFT_162477 [Capitella teleta]|eukprot:ELT87755.1 hypothetical protein CAPTEDRAFT_162477 [Capitella teleta]